MQSYYILVAICLLAATINSQFIPPTFPGGGGDDGPDGPNGYFPVNISLSYTIPASSFSAPILAVVPALGRGSCTSNLIILLDSTTECLVFAMANGTVLSSSCDPLLVGAKSIVCAELYCYIANPVSGDIVIISNYDGAIVTNLNQGSIQPSHITVHEDGYSWIYMFVIDHASNALWYFKIDLFSPYSFYSEENLYNSTSTGEPAGVLFAPADGYDDRGKVYLSFSGDSQVDGFYFTAGYSVYLPTEFVALKNFSNDYTSVECIYMDFFDRQFIFDSGTQLTQVFTPLREMVANLTESPTFISSTRNNIFMLVGGDVKVFEEAIHVAVSLTNKQCDSRLAVLDIVVTGGSLPFSARLEPENTYQQSYDVWSPETPMSWYDLDVLPPLYPFPVFNDEGFSSSFMLYPDQTLVNSSVVKPNTGSVSFSILIDQIDGFSFYCSDDCISGRYTAMEFYLNVGKGGQNFTIDFAYHDVNYNRVVAKTFTVLEGEYPLNNWTKVAIPMNFGLGIGEIFFANIGTDPIENPIFVDDWYFVTGPYSPARKVKVVDYCGATYATPDIVVSNDNALSIKLETTAATCSAALKNTNSILASDGSVTAVITNGQAPFVYAWGFPNASANYTVSNLEEFNSFYNIYDNKLQSGWFDTSILPSRNFKDTTHYHSFPHSISLLQPVAGDGLYLKLTAPAPISVTRTSTLTFWVHGGDTGGQLLRLAMRMFKEDLEVRMVSDLIPGVKSILPNVWMQATLRPAYAYKFNAFLIKQDCPQSGFGCPNTVYLDDFVLSAAPALTVTDATGCRSRAMDLAITAPTTLKVTAAANHAKCYNSTSGFVALDVAGGVAPYVVEYSAGNVPKTRAAQTIKEIASLAESKVSINVTDANGCIATRVVETVLQPPPLSLKFELAPVKCYGGSTTISSTMSGGIAPYTYTWSSTGAVTPVPQPSPRPIFTDSLALTYSISSNVLTQCLGTGSQIGLSYPPTHAGYCSLFPTFSPSNPSVVITAPSVAASQFAGVGMWVYIELIADANKLAVSLAKDGSAVSTPVALSSLGKITAGAWNKVYYNISATALSDPKPNQIVITSSAPSSMGMVILDDIVLMPLTATSVGIVVYPGFNSMVSGTAGQYFLTIVDGNGCSFVKQVNIEQPPQIIVEVNITAATSSNATDGAIYAFASGGAPPYAFFWRTQNSNGPNATGLSYGGYELQVTDANGCLFSETFVVPVEEIQAIRAYAKGISVGLGVFVGVSAILGIFSVVMLGVFLSSFIKFGVVYSFVINIGVLVSYIAVLTLVPRPTDALCTAFPWLLGIAFCMVYSCLFVKIWSVYRTWTNAKDPNTGVKSSHILRVLAMALVIEIAVLAAWTASDPPKVKRVEVVNDELQDQCKTEHPTFWIIFITLKGAWLLLGAVLSIIARKALAERDSGNVAYATYNFLLLLVIGIPLGVFLDKVPSARMVICLILPVIAFTSTLFIMFFKTWHATIFHDQIKFPKTNPNTNSANSRNSSTFSASSQSQQSQSGTSHSASVY